MFQYPFATADWIIVKIPRPGDKPGRVGQNPGTLVLWKQKRLLGLISPGFVQQIIKLHIRSTGSAFDRDRSFTLCLQSGDVLLVIFEVRIIYIITDIIQILFKLFVRAWIRHEIFVGGQ